MLNIPKEDPDSPHGPRNVAEELRRLAAISSKEAHLRYTIQTFANRMIAECAIDVLCEWVGKLPPLVCVESPNRE